MAAVLSVVRAEAWGVGDPDPTGKAALLSNWQSECTTMNKFAR